MHRRYDSKHIPIELLRTFVAIADLGNFTKAAQELELTQPAISAQMKRLQQLMGGEIFLKSTTARRLTARVASSSHATVRQASPSDWPQDMSTWHSPWLHRS